MTKVEALKELYVKLGGNASDVASVDNIADMIEKVKNIAENGGELPEGGSNGQVLTKSSNGAVSADVPTELPSGGKAGDVLKKTATGTEWGQAGGNIVEDITQMFTYSSDMQNWMEDNDYVFDLFSHKAVKMGNLVFFSMLMLSNDQPDDNLPMHMFDVDESIASRLYDISPWTEESRYKMSSGTQLISYFAEFASVGFQSSDNASLRGGIVSASLDNGSLSFYEVIDDEGNSRYNKIAISLDSDVKVGVFMTLYLVDEA